MAYKEKSLAELIEEAKERVANEREFERELHEEAQRERSLSECYDIIKQWKKHYLKKKQKAPATIYARVESQLLDGGWFDRRFIQVFRNGKLEAQFQVRPEAFDTLTRGIPETTTIPGRNVTSHLYELHKHEYNATA